MERRYPDFFPDGCPPDNAQDIDLHVYRFCACPDNVSESDFISYYEDNPEKFNDKIEYYGLSVVTDIKEAQYGLILPFIRRKHKGFCGGNTLGYGVVLSTSSKNFKTHCTWWLYHGARPHLSFLVCGGDL